VEGWVEYIVNEALSSRNPSTPAMARAWQNRRNSGGSAEKAFAKVVGIDCGATKVEASAELWLRSTVADGVDKRDYVWDHLDLLPAAEHLDNPAAFIDGLLDDASSDDFDAEFAKLEEMLRSGDTGVSEDDEIKKDHDAKSDGSDADDEGDEGKDESDSDSDDK